MARQFDLYRLRDGAYVVVLQSDLLDSLNTRAVCLAVPETDPAPTIPSLSPRLNAGDLHLRLSPQLLATLTLPELGTFVTSLAHERDRIIRDFDVLVSGT